MTLAAFARIWSQSPAWTAAGSNKGATRPTDAAPFMRKSPALSRSTPDVGFSRSMGRAAETALNTRARRRRPGRFSAAARRAVGVVRLRRRLAARDDHDV